MEYEFFTPQVVEGDAFLFRIILHYWSDEHVIRILQATIPAFKKGCPDRSQ
jgi:hypothetical protein